MNQNIYQNLLSTDPIGAFNKIRENYMRYFKTMYRFSDQELNDRKDIELQSNNNLFREPLLEILTEYNITQVDGKTIKDITEISSLIHKGFNGDSIITKRFISDFIKPGLMNYPPYQHQTDMLTKAFVNRSNVVINSGTGSGKTESFLLPLLASLYKEGKQWQAPEYEHQIWFNTTVGNNQYEPIQRLGENRRAAMRALILYPMNALVEDQMTRLRKALDCDDVREHLDSKEGLNGNRIYFGQYNGSTITSGNYQGQENRAKREFCFNQLQEKALQSANIERFVSNPDVNKDDVNYITPRLTLNSRTSEMVTRWDMQEYPPDILITNFSMLSIMLMRSIEENVFESTKNWLRESKENTFHLIVDELHLFRGTSGTEIAYLIKMFLDAIGLRPVIKVNGKNEPNPQLRILASSASLGDEGNTQDYLEQFFGVYFENSDYKAFEIQKGDDYDPKLGELFDLEAFSTIEESYLFKSEHEKKIIRNSVAKKLGYDDLIIFLEDHSQSIFKQWINCCTNDKNKIVPKELSHISNSLFNGNINALRGFLIIRGEKDIVDNRKVRLPRIRFHQFYKYIEGLWAELLPQFEGVHTQKAFGKLMYTPLSAVNGIDGTIHKVLETLRCEKCAAPFIGGNKHPRPRSNNSRHLNLSLNSPELHKIPNSQVTPLVQNKWYQDYAIFWPNDTKNERFAIVDENGERVDFRQTDSNGIFAFSRTNVRGNWRKSFLNPYSAELFIQDNSPAAEYIEGYTFILMLDHGNNEEPIDFLQDNNIGLMQAMPHVCPSCNADYTNRLYTKSPIRSFRTGIARSNQVLSKELIYQLEKENPKLVGFSDSRQDAAKQAFGIEKEHFRDIVRMLFLESIEELSRPDPKIIEFINKAKKLREGIFIQIPEYSKLIPDAASIAIEIINNNDKALEKYLNPKLSFSIEDLVETEQNQLNGILVKKLLNLGINPNGVGFDKESENGFHWSDFYNFEDGCIANRDTIRNRVRNNNFEIRQNFVTDVKDSLFATIFQNSFGIYTDVNSESAGIGYLSLKQDKTNEYYMALQNLLPNSVNLDNVLDAFVRIMGDNYRYNNPDFRSSLNRDDAFDSYRRLTAKFRAPIEALADLHSLETIKLGNNLVSYLNHVFGNDRFQIFPNGLEFKYIQQDKDYFKCNNCNKIHLHSGMGLCTNIQCLEQLPSNSSGSVIELRNENFISFDLLQEPRTPIRLRTAELTGQTDNQAERQLQFKGVIVQNNLSEQKKDKLSNEIDMINVTTTMEVGVDIGSLQAIFQGNMPPTRYNYQQRVGRGGRRGQAFSAAMTFCRGKSHDNYYYYDGIEEITGGDAPPPILSLKPNETDGELKIKIPILRRMLVKNILKEAFLTIVVEDINEDTHGQFGIASEWNTYRPQLENWINENTDIIEDYLTYYTSQYNTDNRLKKDIDNIRQWITNDLLIEIDRAVETTAYTVGLAQSMAESGLLPMYGMPSGTRNFYHGSNRMEIRSIDRTLEQAITEFAPGSIKTKDKGEYESVGLTIPLKINRNYEVNAFTRFNGDNHNQFDALEYSYDLELESEENGSIRRIGNYDINLEGQPNHIRLVVPKAFRTGRILNNTGNSADNTDVLSSYSSSSIFAIENDNPTKRKDIFNARISYFDYNAEIWHINNNNGEYFEGVSTKNFRRSENNWENITINNSNEEDIFTPNFILDRYIRKGENDQTQRIALGAKKITEMLKIEILNYSEEIDLSVQTGNSQAIRAAFYSAAFILQRVTTDILDVDPQEIEISELKFNEQGVPSLFLSDAAPNGSGFVNFLNENFESILNQILAGKQQFIKSIIEHKNLCNSSCQKCLNTYGNSGFHHILDWRLGIGLLRLINDASYTFGFDKKEEEYFELEDLGNIINSTSETYSRIDDKTDLRQGDRFNFLVVKGNPLIGKNDYFKGVIHPLWNKHYVIENINIFYSRDITINENDFIDIFRALRTLKM